VAQRQVKFNTASEGWQEDMARFCAELVRQGVNFEGQDYGGYYLITFNGGF
jgi:hypothetical protein